MKSNAKCKQCKKAESKNYDDVTYDTLASLHPISDIISYKQLIKGEHTKCRSNIITD